MKSHITLSYEWMNNSCNPPLNGQKTHIRCPGVWMMYAREKKKGKRLVTFGEMPSEGGPIRSSRNYGRW